MGAGGLSTRLIVVVFLTTTLMLDYTVVIIVAFQSPLSAALGVSLRTNRFGFLPLSRRHPTTPSSPYLNTAATVQRLPPPLFGSNSRSASSSKSNGEPLDQDFNRNTTASSGQQQPQQLDSNDERQKRILGARRKIEVLLNGPDPPFDIETAMKQVTSIAPPSPPTHLQRAVDVRSEEHISQLEDHMVQAMQRQDFTTAAAVQEEISQLHIDDCGAVLQVNANYYRAFSTKQWEDMQAVWWKDGTATCIHPSQKALVGSKAVLQSWKRMFESSNGAFQKSWMEPHNIHLSVKGATTAVLTCDEHVYARRFIRGQRRETELVNKLVATNIFRKCQGKWFLTYHHASWHAESEAAKQALAVRGRGGGMSTTSGSSSSASSKRNNQPRPPPTTNDEAAFQHWIGEQLLGGLGLDGSNDEDYLNEEEDDDDDDSNEDKIGLDGILGIPNFGPLIGGDAGSAKNSRGSNRSKKVPGVPSIHILGSTSSNSGPSSSASSSSSSGGGNNGAGAFGKAIIRIDGKSAPKNSNNNNKSFDLGDFAQEMMQDMDETDDDDEDDDDDDNDNEEEDWDEAEQARAIRQSCVAALRKLHAMGAISPRQKRVLLTNIISCAAKGEVSLVEVAYQVLFDFDEDEDDDNNNDRTKENDKNQSSSRNTTSANSTISTTDQSNSSSSSSSNIGMGRKKTKGGAGGERDDESNELQQMAHEEFAEQCRVIATTLLDSSTTSQ